LSEKRRELRDHEEQHQLKGWSEESEPHRNSQEALRGREKKTMKKEISSKEKKKSNYDEIKILLK
jgi:hypothetical protein